MNADRAALDLLLDGVPETDPRWKALLDRVQVALGKRCYYCNGERVESARCFDTVSHHCEDCLEQWETDRQGRIHS